MKCVARYFDGKCGKRHEVFLEYGDAEMHLVGEGVEEKWAYDDIICLQRKEGVQGEMIVTLRGCEGVRLILGESAEEGVSLLSRRLKGRSDRTGWVWAPSGVRGAMVVMLLIGVVVGGLIWSLPKFLSYGVKYIPTRWEKPLGRYVVQNIELLGVVEDDAANAAMAKIVNRLVKGSEYGEDIHVTIVKSKMVNAFAAPGGEIVVFGGLVDFVETPEELAGVLAHEMGHLMKRHCAQAVMQEFLLGGALLSVGGSSGAGIGKELVSLGYSREHEEEADEIGAQLLDTAGISRTGLVSFFERLESEQGKNWDALKYFSSHPATHSRIEAVGGDVQDAGKKKRKKVLTKKEWKTLKRACAIEKKENVRS